MKFYATFDEEGHKTGGYLESHKNIPPEAIEVSREDFGKYNNGYIRNPNTGVPEITPVKEPTETEKLTALKQEKLSILKQKLADTDYKQSKFIDGDLTEEEYAETKEQRALWRSAYNRIETAETITEVTAISEDVSI
jgi:hypothetical protein